MGYMRNGKWVNLPWNDEFNHQLMRLGETTYQHSGDDLLHHIHMQTIETTHISIRFYQRLRMWLVTVVALQIAIFAYLVYRL
ncbi:hypothetical protein ACO2I3_06815 [Leptospira interrogans]